jgi:glycine/D-amino acid oxidase-like deaminating enzyme
MAGEFGVWETTAPAAPALPELSGNIDSEVAIVGAGYTGLSTALHLAESGKPAVVIEAREPGFGASGRNTGWLEPNWWLKTPAQIDARFGKDRGRELTRWVAGGPKLLEQWARTYDMRIEAARLGLLMATDNPKKAGALASEAGDWQKAGVANEYLDGAAIRAHIASDRYCGAIWLRDGMTLNPLALSRELARACVARGTRVFGNSPVTAVKREAGQWRSGRSSRAPSPSGISLSSPPHLTRPCGS